MRTVQVLLWGVFAALIVGCGAWAVVWFAKSPPPTAIQAAREPTSVIVSSIHLNSDPQGADAITSFGWSCRTPCSIELSAEAPFTVTFTRPGFSPSTIPVEIEAAHSGASNTKFAPNPVFAALQPLRTPKAKGAVPARRAGIHTAAPRDVHEGQGWWCRLFRCS